MKTFRGVATWLIACVATLALAQPAWAFCGFYVAKADTDLYNQASQVIIARDGDRTVLTMANDYQGEVKDFALVVPVPVILQEDQVNVAEPKILERLDSFSAPRLVEYFDEDPCAIRDYEEFDGATLNRLPSAADPKESRDESLGVTVESKFSVGEYDIVILSAKESDGLETWLQQNNYKIPDGASKLLQPYIRQNLKFFVAKVNLEEFEKSEFQSLRPLMMAYESSRFMLPIRLGTMNAKGPQDLIVYLLSPKGQTELTNYRMVKIPSDTELPEFVEEEFGDFYQSMFQKAYERENKKVAFLEYAWDMSWCDPCAANPLTPEELRQAGVFWLNQGGNPNLGSPAQNVFITRLHVRYTRDNFPEDLRFAETANRENFQGRYVIRHPFTGEMDCPQAKEYKQALAQRQEKEVQTLAKLTKWNIAEIRKKARIEASKPTPWWRNIFR
ncbi:MAG: DUF2330 domain-containing protein [Spirulinaceae cyanobacterium]